MWSLIIQYLYDVTNLESGITNLMIEASIVINKTTLCQVSDVIYIISRKGKRSTEVKSN